VLALLAVFSAWLGPIISRKFHEPPVILIIIDTLPAEHLGCYGYNKNTTPHLDRLSDQGVMFKRAMAASP